MKAGPLFRYDLPSLPKLSRLQRFTVRLDHARSVRDHGQRRDTTGAPRSRCDACWTQQGLRLDRWRLRPLGCHGRGCLGGPWASSFLIPGRSSDDRGGVDRIKASEFAAIVLTIEIRANVRNTKSWKSLHWKSFPASNVCNGLPNAPTTPSSSPIRIAHYVNVQRTRRVQDQHEYLHRITCDMKSRCDIQPTNVESMLERRIAR